MDAGPSKTDEGGGNIFTKITTEFKSDIIKETLKLQYGDAKTKITEEAVELIKEITKAMVVEAAIRSAKQTALENKSTVTVNHVENMLPQMMLDFP